MQTRFSCAHAIGNGPACRTHSRLGIGVPIEPTKPPEAVALVVGAAGPASVLTARARARHLKGSSGGTIRNFLNAGAAGPLAELKLQNVTVSASVASGNRPPQLLYFGSGLSTKMQAPPDAAIWSNVYVDGSYSGVPHDQTAYARPAPQPDGCAIFNPDLRITGCVCLGPSRGGESSTADRVGLNYDREHFCGPEDVGQCDPHQIPPSPARDAGFTRLAFCEDFSDKNTINLDGTLAGGQTLTQVKPGNIFNSSLMPKTAFVFNADGTMTVNPTRTNYQIDFISTVPTGDGGYSGYAMDGSNWYAEIRWKHSACVQSSGFPAFWSMDARKLYASTTNTYEPDFYEKINGSLVQSLHFYPTAGNNDGRKSVINSGRMSVPITGYFTAGALASANGSKYAWYVNDVKTKETSVGNPTAFRAGRFPIMFGAGPSCPYTVDWVRVWR